MVYLNAYMKAKIASRYKKNIYKQEYSKKISIKDVVICELRDIASEEGALVEVMRLNGSGESQVFPGFKVLQINYSVMFPGSVKAWHVHFKQDDVWYVTDSSPLLVGLVDLREKSPTLNVSMRFVLGVGRSKLLYIPKGVAHGVANLNLGIGEVFYFLNQHFSIEDSDENRLSWDHFGKDFWEMRKG